MDLKQLNPQYITNKRGKKTAVILPINTFEELLADMVDLAVIAERKDEPTISHEQLIEELKQDGLI